EVQDEGSQLLAWLVAPRRGEMVADYCAGAGGKTLALAMLMRGSGRIYAMDVSARRLAALAPRAARAQVTNVHSVALSGDIDAFANTHPEFAPLSCGEILTAQRIALQTGFHLRLWPHLHATDGFFAATFQRRA